MTMMKTGDYMAYNQMPVYAVQNLLDWKFKYEEQKRKVTEEETEKQRREASRTRYK